MAWMYGLLLRVAGSYSNTSMRMVLLSFLGVESARAAVVSRFTRFCEYNVAIMLALMG